MDNNSTAPLDFTVTVDCSSGNEYSSDNLGVRISSIFVILFGSLMGALVPIYMARAKRMHVPKLAFFVAKYFGSGVIIATAFIHLLAPATSALQSPCLDGPITDYPWAEGIALMTTFVMFFIELMAIRFQLFGEQAANLEAADPAMDLIRGSKFKGDDRSDDVEHQESEQNPRTENSLNGTSGASKSMETSGGPPNNQPNDQPSTGADGIQNSAGDVVPERTGDLSYPPGGEDHLGHNRTHKDDMEYFAAQMTALFILEFGVVFHSIFIGLTLAVAGEEFNILYVVLVFHQTFEGLGLGSRLATAQWPRSKRWMPWVLGIVYGLTTPVAIGAGLGVSQSLEPGSSQMLIINGVFDSISAGILIYTGLVELMAHEFMFNQGMQKSSIWMMLSAFGCMCLGAGLMALLGKWA